MTTMKPHPKAPWDRKAKPRRYVTRWIVAYEWLAPWGRWQRGTVICDTRAEARAAIDHLRDPDTARSIMPPQAVKVRIK